MTADYSNAFRVRPHLPPLHIRHRPASPLALLRAEPGSAWRCRPTLHIRTGWRSAPAWAVCTSPMPCVSRDRERRTGQPHAIPDTPSSPPNPRTLFLLNAPPFPLALPYPFARSLQCRWTGPGRRTSWIWSHGQAGRRCRSRSTRSSHTSCSKGMPLARCQNTPHPDPHT